MRQKKEWLTPGETPKLRVKQELLPKETVICAFWIVLEGCTWDAGKKYYCQQEALYCPDAPHDSVGETP